MFRNGTAFYSLTANLFLALEKFTEARANQLFMRRSKFLSPSQHSLGASAVWPGESKVPIAKQKKDAQNLCNCDDAFGNIEILIPA